MSKEKQSGNQLSLLSEELMTTEQVAEFLGKCKKTVRRYVKNFGLKAHPLPGRELRFFKSEVIEWLYKRQAA